MLLFDQVINCKLYKFVMIIGLVIMLLFGYVIVWNVYMCGYVNYMVYVLYVECVSVWLVVLFLFQCEVWVLCLQVMGVFVEISCVEEVILLLLCSDRGWMFCFDVIYSDSICSVCFGKLLIIGKGWGMVGFFKQLCGGLLEFFEFEVVFSDVDISFDGVQLLGDMDFIVCFSYLCYYWDQVFGLVKLKLLYVQFEVDVCSQGLCMDMDVIMLKIFSVFVFGCLQLVLYLIDGQLQFGDCVIWQVLFYLGDGVFNCGVLVLQFNVFNDLCLQVCLLFKFGLGSEVDVDLCVCGWEIFFQQFVQLLECSFGIVCGEWMFILFNWIFVLFVCKLWLQLDGGGMLKVDLCVCNGELIEGSIVDILVVEVVVEVVGV